jgi:sugar O-acyltransferase (sialic acid O-acetyltransferase NeuD family)
VRNLVLLAASGLAREVASAAQNSHRIVGILDDDVDLYGTLIAGVRVLGPIDRASSMDAELLLCVGSGSGRASVARRLGLLGVGDDRFATIVDESVRVPESCTVGVGSILLAGTVLTADVSIGRHVVLMPRVTLTHDDVLRDFVTAAAGVSLGGGVIVGETSYLGMNSSVRQGVEIGRGAVVGMGAVVLNDVPAGETWVNVPARPIDRHPSALQPPGSASVAS